MHADIELYGLPAETKREPDPRWLPALDRLITLIRIERQAAENCSSRIIIAVRTERYGEAATLATALASQYERMEKLRLQKALVEILQFETLLSHEAMKRFMDQFQRMGIETEIFGKYRWPMGLRINDNGVTWEFWTVEQVQGYLDERE